MKPKAAPFYAISLCLAIGVIALAYVTQTSNFSNSNRTITPTPTPTPTLSTPPTAMPTTNISYKYPLAFTYDYQTKNLNNGQTAVNYIITAAYHKDTPITINISDFYLKLTVQAGINTVDAGTAKPQNNGTLTLNPSHNSETFELNFQFPTNSSNGAEQATTHFRLQYSGQAKLFGDQ